MANKATKDKVVITHSRTYWGKYCNSAWTGINIKECEAFNDLIQNDESTEPYCEIWGHYLDNDEKNRKVETMLGYESITDYRPLRCKECKEAYRGEDDSEN